MRVPYSVTILRHALSDNYPDVRQRAVEALGQLGSPQAVAPLLRYLQAQDENIFWYSI